VWLPFKDRAYDEIKAAEDMKTRTLHEKYEQGMKSMREEMNEQFAQIMSMIQQNP
jgi:hypothetical protein